MTGAVTTALTTANREAITRAVLNAPAEQSHKLLSGQVGISPEAVRKIRYGLMYASHCPGLERLDPSSRASTGRFIADPEAVVRAVFDAPCELSHQEVAQLVGISATTAKEIRLGRKWPEILPHIVRFETMARLCTGCLHWESRRMLATATEPDRSGLCQLGIPEATNVHFGRGCSAWAEVRK